MTYLLYIISLPPIIALKNINAVSLLQGIINWFPFPIESHSQLSSMLTPEIICATFAADINEPRNPYHGKYTSILCTAFIQFLSSLKFLDHNLDEMTVLHPTTEKPVFIFLIAPENTPATSGHAEDTMLKLLKGLPFMNTTVNDGLSRLRPKDKYITTGI